MERVTVNRVEVVETLTTTNPKKNTEGKPLTTKHSRISREVKCNGQRIYLEEYPLALLPGAQHPAISQFLDFAYEGARHAHLKEGKTTKRLSKRLFLKLSLWMVWVLFVLAVTLVITLYLKP